MDLLENYYPEEIGEIFYEYNEIHKPRDKKGTSGNEVTKEVTGNAFFGF